MNRRFPIAMFVVFALVCAIAPVSAADEDDPALAVFEDPARLIARDAFAWGTTLHARASNLDSRCWRIVWKDPAGVVVRTDLLAGTAGTRDIAFSVPAAGPSGTWTADLQQGNQNPGGSNPCAATTSYTTRHIVRFDAARVVIMGAVEGGGLGGDGRVDQNNPGTVQDGGTGSNLYVRSDKDRNRRTFVRFDLSGAGVSGSVTSARLRLFMSSAPNSSRTYEVRRATGSWLESTLKWSNKPAAGSITNSQSTGSTSSVPIYWLVGGDVAGFANGTLSNYGWEIRDSSEDRTSSSREARFVSTEASSTNRTRWPVLLVDYSDQAPVISAGGPYSTTCRTASVGGASALDPEGSALTYSWSSSNPNVTVSPAAGTIGAGSGMRPIPPATATLSSGVAPSGQSATLTLTVGDGGGNTVTATATAMFNDNLQPQITSPASVTTGTSADGPGNCTTTVSLGLPVVGDNCTLPAGIVVTNNAPATFPVGQTIVTWTARDQAGNTSSATQTVTVNDVENPALSGMPAALALGTGPGATTASAVASWTAPQASDNCPGVTLTSSHAPGTSFPLGVTTVTYTATDAAGRTTSQTFTVTVTDNTKPVIVAGANLTVPTDDGQCGALIAALGTTASDNAPGVTLAGVRSDGAALGAAFPKGVTTIAWTATDGAGNTSSATQTVTVNDVENPALSGMPAALALGTGPGATTASAVASWTAPQASDNCPGVTLTSSHAPGASFPLGVTTVTCTASDAAGRTTSQTFTVTVTDNTKPVIVAGANLTVPTDDGQCGALIVALGTTASDNAPGVTLAGVRSDGAALGAAFPKGVTTIAWTATDGAGNTSSATQTVTVNDAENPTLSGMPGALARGIAPGSTTASAAASWTAPQASDNCPGVTLISSHAPGASFPLGVTTVTYTATDAAGNTVSQSFTVTVADDTPPVIVAADLTVPSDDGQCGAQVASLGATASDNAPGVTLAGVRADGAALGDAFPKGTTTIAWSATDAGGNTESLTQVVTVSDDEAPALIGMPAALTLGIAPGSTTPTAVASWTAPQASDNCPGVTLGSSHSPGASFPLGVTTVTYTASDAAGHTTSQSFTVTVADETPPVIVAPDLTVPTDDGQCAAQVASLGATASDDSPGVTLVGARGDGLALGAPFSKGITTIAWTATDAAGNTDSAIQTVTVNDAESPTLSGMPAALAFGIASGSTGAVASWTAPQASDNCPGATLVSSHAPGGSFPLGVTTVTYTATDAAGNAASQSFTVTVADDTPPVIVVADLTVPTDDGQCGAQIASLGATASDDSPGVTLVGVRADGMALGAPFPKGMTVIAWQATDAAGNTDSAIQTVTVNDAESPALSGMPAALALGIPAGSPTSSAVASWTAPQASDNCPGVTLGSNHAPGESFPLGVTTVTYTATDAAGHTTSQSFTVTVADDTPPVIVAADLTIPTDEGQCAARPASLGATVSDNAPGVTLTGVRSDGLALGDAFPKGVTTIVWTATDVAGNSESLIQTVTVNDVEAPALSGVPAALELATGPGATTANVTASWTAPVVSDNCPGVTLSSSHASGANFAIGVTTVTYTATDAAGNVTIRSFTVTVTDDTEPVLLVSDKTAMTHAGFCGALVSNLGATASDNAPGVTLVGVRGDGAVLGAPFPAGVTPIAWIATDASGNTVSASQAVTVMDTEKPVITPGAPVDVVPDPGLTTARVTLVAPTASDNCPGVIVGGTRSDGLALDQPYSAGVTTITWTATDVSGNQKSATQTVTVGDRVNPAIALGANLTVPTAAGQCAALVTSFGTTASDNAPGVTLTGVRSDGAGLAQPFPKGATTITWTATDASGNTASATQTVTVNDLQPPVFSVMPADLEVGTGPGATTASAVASWAAPVPSDNCPGVTRTSSHVPGQTFLLGVTTVTYTATDASGNVTSRSFTVTVRDDTEPWIFVTDKTVSNNGGQCGAFVTNLGAIASDNAPGVTLAAVRGDGLSLGAPFPVGVTPIAWIATDAAGNTGGTTQAVTVSDVEMPVIARGANLRVEADAGLNTALIANLGTTGGDNCPGVTLQGTRSDGAAIGDPYPTGVTTITWRATDVSGNQSSAQQTVEVFDNLGPVIMLGPDITVPTDDDQCTAIVATLGTTASDNTPGVTLVGMRGDGAPLSAPFPAGATPILWTATDVSGNTETAIQTVAVLDTESPAILAPPAIHAGTGVGATTASVIVTDLQLGAAFASDNCGGTTVTRSGVPAGNRFPVGVTEIRYTASDQNGNTTTVTQLVTVVDNTPPVLARPADITRISDPGTCVAAVTLSAVASDNVPGPVVVTFSPPSGSFPLGASTVICTATDAAGNQTISAFTVTVSNPAPVPAIIGPAVGTIVPAGSPVSLTGSFTDNAGDVHTARWLVDSFAIPGTVNETNGSVTGSYAFPAAGVYRVQLPVTDKCGGSATAARIGPLDEVIVVFDPGAEFVAGGGKFDSPAGALTADPARAGEAGFGFVSRARRGPAGVAEFHFQLESFRFHAPSCDALTIEDGTALYRGTGTVNEAGSYGFVLSAVDGHEVGDGIDRIRLKITNLSTGGVVYDNEPGAEDTAPAATAISGGAIEVHPTALVASTRAIDAEPEGTGSQAAAVPIAYALSQNFPNPFAGSTGLRFDLPRPSAVTLAVYDVLGREVASLVRGELPAGRHQHTWNARVGRDGPMPAGVYVVSMEATPLSGGRTFTTKRKLVLLP